MGPRTVLDRFGIPVIVDLPGVGENLQDRYEVGVISRFTRDFALLEGATFSPPELGSDPVTFLKNIRRLAPMPIVFLFR